jgi:hypothetical protein
MTTCDFEKFKELIFRWSHDNAGFSFERGEHINCKEILSFENKEDVIRFSCVLLGHEKLCHQLFYLLYRLVDKKDQPPIDNFYSGRVQVMLECWKYWALNKGYVNIKYNLKKYWVEDKYGNVGNWS